MNFDEYRLVIQPDVTNPDSWSIRVENSPKVMFNRSHGTSVCKVTRVEIGRLRNPTAPPNAALLKELGKNVLDSIMTETAFLGFEACLEDAINNGRGLRLVVEIVGGQRGANGVSLQEVPLEAVFHQQLDFFATNVKTPVSRGVAPKNDRSAIPVNLPIRILLVTSEPTDMPAVDAVAEKQAILGALKPLIDTRAVVVDTCEPPTVTQFNNKLQEGYHIVHFIGHGDYEIVGLDPSPQPHLYFEDETPARRRKPVDAGQLFTLLRNGNIPLVVLTACKTAATLANGPDYPVIAFESLAQNLVERQSGPLAAVAMQFDLETAAAEVFSKAFYTRLLSPGWNLDETISNARSVLLTVFGAGHRSWVNPTLYWRCKDGRVFDIRNTDDDLSPEARQKIGPIDSLIEVYMTWLDRLSKEPAATRAATSNLQNEWQAKIDELTNERGILLGDSIRLRGGKPDANGEVEAVLTIRTRLPAVLGDITGKVKYDPAEFNLQSHSSGSNVSQNAVFLQSTADGESDILVRDAGNGVQWEPGEYELARIRLRLADPSAKAIFHIGFQGASAEVGGVLRQFRSLNAVVFGDLVDS